MASDRIIIGKIVKAHGIRGEVKVYPLTDDPARFSHLDKAYVGGKLMHAVSARQSPPHVIVAFDGVPDRNVAESLAGAEVAVERCDAVKLEDGRHFIVDLIGCSVTDGKHVLGVLKDVLQSRAADVYVLDDNGKTVMFPAVDKVLVSTDVENKLITVDGKAFLEVAVYED